jgi:hypothetical protein
MQEIAVFSKLKRIYPETKNRKSNITEDFQYQNVQERKICDLFRIFTQIIEKTESNPLRKLYEFFKNKN